MLDADTEALKALIAHRIPAALKRITDGHGLMRVPAEDTDPDLVLADCKIALERMLASQTQDEEPVNPADIPTLSEIRELLSAAPVASQMGEPIYQCKHRASIGASSGWEDCSKEQYDNAADWDRRVLYTAPAAGMDADKTK